MVSIPHRYSTNSNRLMLQELLVKSFNPSQVFYKLKKKYKKHRNAKLFQSLIGILQTEKLFDKPSTSKKVSIPHRYSTNLTASLYLSCVFQVSIPHRYSTNSFLFLSFPFINSVSIPHRYSTNKPATASACLVFISFNPSQVFYKLALFRQ